VPEINNSVLLRLEKLIRSNSAYYRLASFIVNNNHEPHGNTYYISGLSSKAVKNPWRILSSAEWNGWKRWAMPTHVTGKYDNVSLPNYASTYRPYSQKAVSRFLECPLLTQISQNIIDLKLAIFCRHVKQFVVLYRYAKRNKILSNCFWDIDANSCTHQNRDTPLWNYTRWYDERSINCPNQKWI